jgi:hypothetical protein
MTTLQVERTQEILLRLTTFYLYQWRLIPMYVMCNRNHCVISIWCSPFEDLLENEQPSSNECTIILAMEQLCHVVPATMLTDPQPAIFPHLELALVDANSLTRPRHVQLLRIIAHSHQTRRQALSVDTVSRRVLRRLVQHEIEGVVREGQRLHLLLRLLGSDSVTIGGQMAEYGFLPCRMFRPTAAHLSA